MGVDVGGGLVQDDDARVAHYGAGKAEQLPLPHAEVHAALRQHGVIAVVQRHNEIVGADGPGGLLYLRVGDFQVAVADVVADAAGEQIGFLQHHAHLPGQRTAGDIPHIVAVHRDAPLGYIGEAVHQRHQRGLAGPGGADDGGVFAGPQLQVDAGQHLDARHIVEVDVFEPDVAFDGRQFLGVGPVVHFRFQVQHLEDADAGRHRPLQLAVLHREVAHRLEEALNPHGESQQHPPLDLPLPGHPAPGHDDAEAHGDADEQLHERLQAAGEAAGLQVGVQMLRIQLVEVFQIGLLAVETFHHPHAGNVLVVFAVDHGDGPADAGKGMAGEFLPVAQHQEQHRQDAHTDERQFPVHHQHNDHDAHQTEDVRQALDDELESFLQLQHIALAARHNPPHRGAVEESRRQRLQMVEHSGAQRKQDALPHPRNEDELQIVGAEMHQGNAQEHQPHQMQPLQIALVHRPVDADHHQQRHADIAQGVEQHRAQGQQRVALVGQDVGHQAQHHPVVIHLADNLVVGEVVHIGGAHSGHIQAAHPAQHSAESASRPGIAHQSSPAAGAGSGAAPDRLASSSSSSCGRSCRSKISRYSPPAA